MPDCSCGFGPICSSKWGRFLLQRHYGALVASKHAGSHRPEKKETHGRVSNQYNPPMRHERFDHNKKGNLVYVMCIYPVLPPPPPDACFGYT